jgi:hypothetical protein
MTATRPVSVATAGDAWMFHMRHGDFASAWQISDDVLRSRRGAPCSHWPRHLQYVWDGTPLDGQRVLLRCYHGLGDTVQFIRFAPRVKAIAREVIVWAQPALLPILAGVRGIDRLLPLHDGEPEAGYDVDVESMELGHVLRITPESLAASVPYLNIGGSTTPPCRRPGRNIEAGIVWSCGGWNEGRDLPLRELEPLMALSDVRLHVLQRGPARHAWPAGVGVSDGSDNIEATARLMCSLDVVISIDSFPVHLAGALGVPVWVLLQHEADWRWMIGREDSPWYPSARLFRQPASGDWRSVIAAVAAELRLLRAARSAAAASAARVPTPGRAEQSA